MLTALLLSAAIAQAAPPAPPPPPEKKIVREIIVLDGKDGTSVTTPDGQSETRRIVIREGGPKGSTTEDVRIVRVDRDGAAQGEHRIAMTDCDTGSAVSTDQSVTDKDGKKVQTRIMICAKGDPAKRVEALQNAQKRIAENKDLPAETRDRITASLESQIARIKAGGR